MASSVCLFPPLPFLFPLLYLYSSFLPLFRSKFNKCFIRKSLAGKELCPQILYYCLAHRNSLHIFKSLQIGTNTYLPSVGWWELCPKKQTTNARTGSLDDFKTILRLTKCLFVFYDYTILIWIKLMIEFSMGNFSSDPGCK